MKSSSINQICAVGLCFAGTATGLSRAPVKGSSAHKPTNKRQAAPQAKSALEVCGGRVSLRGVMSRRIAWMGATAWRAPKVANAHGAPGARGGEAEEPR